MINEYAYLSINILVNIIEILKDNVEILGFHMLAVSVGIYLCKDKNFR